MMKIRCPKCEKGEKSEVLDVLSDRRYRLKCSDCEFTYVLTGGQHKGTGVCTERKAAVECNEMGGRLYLEHRLLL
jgi:hypothetical protein